MNFYFYITKGNRSHRISIFTLYITITTYRKGISYYKYIDKDEIGLLTNAIQYDPCKVKWIRAIRLLKIAMKRRYLKKTLKSRCRTIIMINKIDYMNENIPQELKEYLAWK